MNTPNKPTVPQPGQTIIAYLDDSTACVGVVVQNTNNERKDYLNILMLGYFSDYPSKQDIFQHTISFPLPSYQSIAAHKVFPYEFSKEIKLCQERNDDWWRNSNPPCRTNLVARFFQPQYSTELQYIAAAIHIFNGDTFDNFNSFRHLGMERFLKLWAVLFAHFPHFVTRPPQELDEQNSNAYYIVDMNIEPPYVICKYRSTT